MNKMIHRFLLLVASRWKGVVVVVVFVVVAVVNVARLFLFID